MAQNQTRDQMEMFGYTAEGAQQEADKFVGKAGNLEEDISKAASSLVPFYDSGVNIVNVAQEYMKPEQERDYDYIKSQFTEAGQSAAIEGGLLLMGGVAGKYGAKGIKALVDKVKQYEINPDAVSAFGVGAIRKKDTFEEVMTPVKATRKKVEQSGEAVLRPSADLASDLNPRLARAMSADTAGSVMPGPGKFFNPSKPGYKGDKFVGMLKDADIELDLEFGNYIMMGKGKPKDVSNETFENLFISARPSEKKTSTSKAFDIKKQRKIKPGEANPNVQNKAVARANLYDGPSLSIEDMKANYLRNTNKPGVEVRTNLLQPGQFSMVTDEGKRALDHPIVAVQNMGGSNKKHFYTLDAQFVGPVRMDRLTKTDKKTGKVPQPNLRPVTVGDVQLGEQIGTIRISTKVTDKNPKGYNDHPLYDYIEVDASKSAPEDMGSIPKFNEGGVAMNDQMEMAFMKQGGIQDDGMNKDPVSGNPIPPGSMATEVRDDIPAMLSEGEYVVPADVLRYYGVNFFEDLRSKAKTGLQTMESDGRIGGQPLSPDQVQRNMQNPPQVNQPTPAPVRASAGMYMNMGTASGQQNFGLSGDTSLDNIPQFNAQDYTVVGGTAYNPPSSNAPAPQSITTTKTFVNANNPSDVRVIEYLNGSVKDPKMAKYTQPPYYEQGSQALADAMKSNDNDDPDPPETDPKPKFGEGVDWTDPMAYAKELVEGPDGLPKIIEGLSVFAGPLGMAASGTASAAVGLQKIANLRATAIIADAQGDQATVDYINAELNKITGKNSSSYFVQALEKSAAPGTAKAIEVLERLNMRYKEKDGKFTFTDKDREYNNLKDRESAIDKQLSDNKSAASGFLKEAETFKDSDAGQEMIDKSSDPEDTAQNLEEVIAGLESGVQTGTIQLNKGGLMSKGKKNKK